MINKYVYHNENPENNRVGDCVVRALSTVLSQEWEVTFTELVLVALKRHDMPSANAVWGAYLKEKGFRRATLPDECPACYTARDFCEDHKTGRYVLAFGTHVCAVINGYYYDTWDSGDEVPQYYFYKEERNE